MKENLDLTTQNITVEESEEISASSEPDASASKEPNSSLSKKEKKNGKFSKTPPLIPVHRWFVTFMCMNIPVIGWIYLLILAFSPSKGPQRDFAKAYLLYKLVFLILSLAILAVALHYGLLVLDKLLAYMEML